jgi:formylmethanofuran dehydrogenase subunit C
MAGVRLTLREAPPQRVDLAALQPAALAGQDAATIARMQLGTARRPLAVGDLFAVTAGADPDLTIAGGSERFDFLGAGLAAGTLLLEGAAGMGLGAGMTGGRLIVRGDAGPYAAAGLAGGEVEITGRAGDHLGGALPGASRGMAGGQVVVRGEAGARAGDRMRRGLLVIEGAAGAATGSRMIAGTLVVCGAAGAMPGTLMRRGTILLGGPAAPGPCFVATALAADGVFLRLLAGALRPLSPAAAALAARARRRFVGDTASLGKGEIFLAETG